MLALATVFALLTACSLPSPHAQFDKTASRVLDQLDAADYAAIYDQAADEFKKGSGGAVGLAAGMGENRRKLGRCGAPVKVGKSRTIPTEYGFVSVQDYGRACANGPANIELSTIGRHGEARLIGLHVSSEALAQDDPLATRPEWISGEDLMLLKQLEIDPETDLETRAAYHWRWRASRILKVGEYVCPPGSAVDVSRTIRVIVAADRKVCTHRNHGEAGMLKLSADGSVMPLGGNAPSAASSQ